MIGAFPWCTVLALIGYILGENWQSIMSYSHVLTLPVMAIVAIIIGTAAVIYILMKKGIIPEGTVKKYQRFITDI